MMSRHGARLAAVLAPAALVLPAAAHAQTASFDDAIGDAKAANLAAELLGDTDGPRFLAAPAETSTDITRTTIDHATKRLTLTVQFRDLVVTDEHSIQYRITTPDGRWGLFAGMSGDRAQAELIPLRLSAETTHDGPLHRPCRTVRARYDVAADTVTSSIPTACIGSPKWVQVSAGAARMSVTPQTDGSVNLAGYVDDAFRSGVSINSMGRSPKIRRG